MTTQQKQNAIRFIALTAEHFEAVISLGVKVHGENYLDANSMEKLYKAGWSNKVNASWVAIDTEHHESEKQQKGQQTSDGYLVGFRLTMAAENWQTDKWCTPNLWQCDKHHVAYFKCNTVDESMRGKGVGSGLLKQSIESLKQQGAQAGLAHIWMQSPGNSAFEYFSASGGKLVKKHPNKWQELCATHNYVCPVCSTSCYCTAAEMIIHFNQQA